MRVSRLVLGVFSNKKGNEEVGTTTLDVIINLVGLIVIPLGFAAVTGWFFAMIIHKKGETKEERKKRAYKYIRRAFWFWLVADLLGMASMNSTRMNLR